MRVSEKFEDGRTDGGANRQRLENTALQTAGAALAVARAVETGRMARRALVLARLQPGAFLFGAAVAGYAAYRFAQRGEERDRRA